nr:venom polypeptide precursor [Doratifera vulnerans]
MFLCFTLFFYFTYFLCHICISDRPTRCITNDQSWSVKSFHLKC